MEKLATLYLEEPISNGFMVALIINELDFTAKAFVVDAFIVW